MKEIARASLAAYARDGVPTGCFLRSVLEHLDVFEVFGHADEENARDMLKILRYIWNEIPGDCHGSRERVRAWLDKHADARNARRDAARDEKADRGVTPEERESLGVEG